MLPLLVLSTLWPAPAVGRDGAAVGGDHDRILNAPTSFSGSDRTGLTSSHSSIVPAELRVDGLASPRTASRSKLRFSWHLVHRRAEGEGGGNTTLRNGIQQKGYVVEVYRRVHALGCVAAADRRVLTSGEIVSMHPYHDHRTGGGEEPMLLAAATEHCWRARATDTDGNPTEWSQWATFATETAWLPASQWIHGPFVRGTEPASTSICATSNGCTSRASLQCIGNGVITKITYASYGGVEQQCPTPKGTNCTGVSESHAIAVVSNLCVGKSSCVVYPKQSTFGGQPCPGNNNVQVLATAQCSIPGRRANVVRRLVALPAIGNVAVTSATAAVSALGYFELHCNGQRVGPGRLEPGRSGRPNNQGGGGVQRVFYTTYDLAGCLHSGNNMIGAKLGNGWFSADGWQPGAVGAPPLFRFQANITLSNGKHVSVVSDGSWTSTPGATLQDSVYMGERQDHGIARALAGWDTATSSTRSTTSNAASQKGSTRAQLWQPVQVGNIVVVMTAQNRPAVIETKQMPALSISSIPTPDDLLSFAPTLYDAAENGAASYVVDFGQ